MAVVVSTIADRVRVRCNTISGGRLEDSDIREFINNFFRFSSRKYLLPWTKRTQDLEIYDGVYSYTAPTDLVVPIEPQKYISEDQNDTFNFHATTQREFARNLNNQNDFAVDWERGTKFLNIRHNEGLGGSLIHNMDDVDENGTWAVSGDGSGLVEDKQIFTEGSASLRFTVTGSGGTTTIVNSTFTAQDLTDYEDKAYFFLELICPSANTSALTSIRLRIGSSSSAYWQMTPTTRHRGDSINAGAGLIGFDWSTATEVGSPSVTAINYAQFVITHPTSGINGVYRIDNFFVALPTYYQLPYYSTGN